MPRPTHTDLHRDTPLTNLSISHARANMGKYGARSCFPSVGVDKKSDKYYVYSKADLLRSQAKKRGTSAEIALGSYGVSDDNYSCENWALGRDIADPERSNADPQFDLDGEATEFLTDQIEHAVDAEWLSQFFTTNVWDTDQTGVAGAPGANQFLQWNDVASTPIEDLRGRIVAVGKHGFAPNKLALGNEVWAKLADHPDLIDRIKHTQLGSPSPQLLAQLLGLDEVVVFNAVENTAAEGATANYTYMAGKQALLLYTTPNPGLRSVTAGLSFVWTGAGVPLVGAAMSRYRLNRNRSDRLEAETWLDFKVVSTALGSFFNNAVA